MVFRSVHEFPYLLASASSEGSDESACVMAHLEIIVSSKYMGLDARKHVFSMCEHQRR